MYELFYQVRVFQITIRNEVCFSVESSCRIAQMSLVSRSSGFFMVLYWTAIINPIMSNTIVNFQFMDFSSDHPSYAYLSFPNADKLISFDCSVVTTILSIISPSITPPFKYNEAERTSASPMASITNGAGKVLPSTVITGPVHLIYEFAVILCPLIASPVPLQSLVH